MKKSILLLFFIIFSCTNKRTPSTEFTSQKTDTLRFFYKDFNVGLQLDLLSDGRFINYNYYSSCTGGGYEKTVEGTYEKDSLKLILFPKKVDYSVYPFSYNEEIKTCHVKYNNDSLKIKTHFQIVWWEQNQYLLSEETLPFLNVNSNNDYLEFIEYYNSGYEPKRSGPYLVNKKTNCSITTPFNKSQLPLKWQNNLRKTPISARVIGYKKIKNPQDPEKSIWKIEIDKGQKDSICNHLILKTENHECYIHIDSVLEKTSFAEVEWKYFPKKIKKGTEFRTKW